MFQSLTHFFSNADTQMVQQDVLFAQYPLVSTIYQSPLLHVYMCKNSENDLVLVSQMKHAEKLIQTCTSKKITLLPIEKILNDQIIIHKLEVQPFVNYFAKEQQVLVLNQRMYKHMLQICKQVQQYHVHGLTHNALSWQNVFVWNKQVQVGLPANTKGKKKLDIQQLQNMCKEYKELHDMLDECTTKTLKTRQLELFCNNEIKIVLIGASATGKSTFTRAVFAKCMLLQYDFHTRQHLQSQGCKFYWYWLELFKSVLQN